MARKTLDGLEVLESYRLVEPGEPCTSIIMGKQLEAKQLRKIVDQILDVKNNPDIYIAPSHIPEKTFYEFFLCYLAHEIWRDKYVHNRNQDMITVARACFQNAIEMSNRRLFGDMRFLDAAERSAAALLMQDDDRTNRERMESIALMSPEDAAAERKKMEAERVARGGKVGRPLKKERTEKQIEKMEKSNSRRAEIHDMKNDLWKEFCSTKDPEEQKARILAKMGEGFTMRNAAMLHTNFVRHGYKGD